MDDGQPLGIEPQQIFETLLVLFHIAEKIGATLSFVLARLGQEDGLYSIKLRVTRPQEEYIDPEIASFVSSLEYLKDKRISYRNNQFGSSFHMDAPSDEMTETNLASRSKSFNVPRGQPDSLASQI